MNVVALNVSIKTSNGFDYSAWVAHRYGVGRYISNHNRTGTYCDIVSDIDTGQDCDATANPDVVADSDRFGPFLAGVALGGVGAVAGGVDAHIGPDEAVVTDSDARFIQNCEVEVGKETLAKAYLLAVVASERLVDSAAVVGDMAYD